MAGLSTNAPGLWGGFAGLLYGSTSLSTPPGFLADATPAWVPAGGVLAFEFDNGLGYNSRNLATTTPDSILTYTNPSAKMVYGSDGVLRYAPHNRFTYSDDISNAAWGKTRGSVASGKFNCDSTADTNHSINQSIAVADVSNVFSVDLKGAEITTVFVQLGGTIIRAVNLATGLLGSYALGTSSASVTAVDDGYYRLTVIGVPSNANVIVFAGEGGGSTLDITLAGIRTGEGFYMRKAQLSYGVTDFDYIPTTTAAVYSLPIDHNPTTFAPLGVLIEEERKNLELQSEAFAGRWSTTASTLTADQAVAPNGTTTADLLKENSATAIHFAEGVVVLGLSVAAVYTISVFVKAAGRRYFNLAGSTSAFGATNYAGFDLQLGITNGLSGFSSSGIQPLDNGWYRIWATGTSAATQNNVFFVLSDGTLARAPSYAGDNTSGVYVWGAQLEAGAFPTSYIPTVASQVTRLADQVSILTSAFGYNAAAGTVAVEAQVPSYVDAANGNYFFSISDGTNSNLIHIAEINGVRSQIVSGAAVQFDSTVGAEPATDVFIKAAVGYAADDMRLARGGSLGTADTSGTVPSGLTILRIGVRGDANFITYLNGRIKRLTYFPVRKTNAELQVLST